MNSSDMVDTTFTLDMYAEKERNDIMSNILNDLKKSTSRKFKPDVTNDNSSTINANNKRTKQEESDGSSEQTYLILHLSIGFVMIVVGIVSLFSRSLKATMLLLLPGVITNRSRYILLTITLGLLVEGPIRHIQINLRKLMANSACLYTGEVSGPKAC